MKLNHIDIKFDTPLEKDKGYFLFIDKELPFNEAKTYYSLNEIEYKKSMLYSQAKINFNYFSMPVVAINDIKQLNLNLDDCYYVVSNTKKYDDLFLKHNLIRDVNYIFYGIHFYIYTK